MKNSQISIRIDENIKDAAEAIFAQMGLSATDAVRMFYHQVIMENGLPFHPKIPNKGTIMAMQQAESGQGQVFATAEDLFKDLGI